MKHVFFCIVTILLSLDIHAGTIIADSLRIDGYWRTFKLYIPDTAPKQNATLVFCLHGYGSHDGNVNNTMYESADRHGFVLCVPLGLCDPKGKHSWNVGYPSQEGWKVDDVKAMCKMGQYVQKKYKLSRENTFFSGMSNGGEMCYLLTYSNQTVFKAFASVAGLTMKWLYLREKQPRPVPFMELHGTDDHTSMWEGDLENKGGWNPYLPVPMAAHAIAATNRCLQEVCDTVQYESTKKHRPIVRHHFIAPEGGCDVWLHEIIGAPHCWFTDDMDTGEVIWQFFSKLVK